MLQILQKTCVVLAVLILMPVAVYAHEGLDNESYDPSVPQGGIIANLLEESGHPLVIYPYESNYFLYTATSGINREAISDDPWAKDTKDNEIEYQISLALPISRGLAGDNSVLGVSYTQSSWWQVLNHKISSPFRETNYESQLFLAWVADYTIAGWPLQEIEVGINHQSNGRSNPASRGWNRGYVRLMSQKDNWRVDLKSWFLIGSNTIVNNPDITKYLGYYRLKVGYSLGNSIFAIQGQYNWNSGYGGAKLKWSYPISPNTRFYAQLFNGYGESLIDYDYHQTRFGIGLILNEP